MKKIFFASAMALSLLACVNDKYNKSPADDAIGNPLQKDSLDRLINNQNRLLEKLKILK